MERRNANTGLYRRSIKRSWNTANSELDPQAEKKSFSAIFSSPLLRARQGAAILSEDFSLPVQIKKDLREGEYGPLEGMTRRGIQTNLC